MSDASQLVKALKQAAVDAVNASKPVQICFGKVTSSSPLQINVEQKMVLGNKQLILTRNVTDYETTLSQTTVTYPEPDENNVDENGNVITPDPVTTTTNNTMTIKNALQAGDEVILVRQQEGQKYIVMDRVIT